MATIEFGDVIYVERDRILFGYKHFGVYSGNRKVIHYTKSGGNSEAEIRETSFEQFIENDINCHVCNFDSCGRQIQSFLEHDNVGIKNPFPLPAMTSNFFCSNRSYLFPAQFNPSPPDSLQLFADGFRVFAQCIDAYNMARTIFSKDLKLYSPQETVERARSCIGQRRYNLLTQNCEHFAVWCKTGVEKSEQISKFINSIADIAFKR